MHSEHILVAGNPRDFPQLAICLSTRCVYKNVSEWSSTMVQLPLMRKGYFKMMLKLINYRPVTES